MYNYHGHPWANILDNKLESKKTFKSSIQNISEEIFEEDSKKEKDFFQQINNDAKLKESKYPMK